MHRAAVLAGHFASADSAEQSLDRQACSGTLFARPASDSAYGRPATDEDVLTSQQGTPAFARPASLSASEQTASRTYGPAHGKQPSSAAPWKPQLFAAEKVDRYELVVPLPRQESGVKVGGLQVSLQAARLKVSGYTVRPISCSVNVRPGTAAGKHQAQVDRTDVTSNPFVLEWKLPEDALQDSIRAVRGNSALRCIVLKR